MADPDRGAYDRRRLLHVLGAGSAIALAGCLGGDDGSSTADGDEEEDSVDPEPVDVAESATWRTATLEDVTTGDAFRIDDFDRPVLVHTFAIGCAVCASQHSQFETLRETAGDEVEIVDLTIESNVNPNRVREHTEEEGFDWRFGVSPEEVTGSLVDDFGQEITVSASSPIIIVCPDGGTYRLSKVVDADELESALEDVC